jgi:hypothetical protein
VLTKERLLHPATIIAVIALLVALSGAGYAATKIGTAQLKNNAVTTPKIKNGAVSTAKLKNNAVNSSKLASGAVAAADLGNGAVTGAKLANDAVTAAKIAGGAVGASALANGSVDAAKLANGAVTTDKLGAGAVTGAKIAGATITAANIAPGQVVTGRGELVSNSLTLGPVTPNTLLLTLPGVASVEADCTDTGANITVNNLTGTTLSAGVTAVLLGMGTLIFPLEQDFPLVQENGGDEGVQTMTLQLTAGTGASSRVATIWVTTDGTAAPGGTGCTVIGQAVSTG